MKKFLSIALLVLLTANTFSQSNFENRKKNGFYHITQAALLMGNRSLSEQSPNYFDDRADFQITPAVTMVFGGMFNEYWAAGVGMGFEIFDRNLFPVFVDIRRTLWDNDVSPYFAFKMGYAFSGFKKKYYDNLALNHAPYNISNVDFKKHGGFMLNPEIGVKVPISEKADLLFTVAYRHQRIKSVVLQNFGQRSIWEYKAEMNRLSFGMAIMFR